MLWLLHIASIHRESMRINWNYWLANMTIEIVCALESLKNLIAKLFCESCALNFCWFSITSIGNAVYTKVWSCISSSTSKLFIGKGYQWYCTDYTAAADCIQSRSWPNMFAVQVRLFHRMNWLVFYSEWHSIFQISIGTIRGSNSASAWMGYCRLRWSRFESTTKSWLGCNKPTEMRSCLSEPNNRRTILYLHTE